MVQAGVYACGAALPEGGRGGARPTTAPRSSRKMKELPTDDPLFGKGTIRADGRKIHPAYLFEVKKPAESKGPYDYYKLRATIPADQAFRPMDQGDCPLVKKTVSDPRPVRRGMHPLARAAADSPWQQGRLWTGSDEVADSDRDLRRPHPGPVRPVADRADQRLVLRAAVAGAGGDLRPAEHHQLHARRAVHDGRLRRLPAAQQAGHRLLVGAAARAARSSAPPAWSSSGCCCPSSTSSTTCTACC